MKFRRPALFHGWSDVIVWPLVSLALLAGAAFVLVEGPAPARISAAMMAAGAIGAIVARFLPRWRDVRATAYRTKQGVAVVLRHGWLPRFGVEAAIDRAIAVHGNGHRLDGVAMYFVRGPLYVLGRRVHGVAEVDVTIAWDDLDGETILGLITHEVSHLLLDGHPDLEHAEMGKRGTV